MKISNLLNFFKNQKTSELFNTFLKTNPLLEEILNHEHTPQEILQGNPLLSAYFTPVHIHKLIAYITEEPQNNQLNYKDFKFPYVSSLFFCPEFSKMLNHFYQDLELLDHLFELLQSEEEINPTLAGYFGKACEILLVVNPEAFLKRFFEKNIHKCIVLHIYSPSIADVLYKLLSFTCEICEFFGEFIDLLKITMEKVSFTDNIQVSIQSSGVIQRAIQYNYDKLYSVYLSNEFLACILNNLENFEGKVIANKLKIIFTLILKPNSIRNVFFIEKILDCLQIFQGLIAKSNKKYDESIDVMLKIISILVLINSEKINERLIKLEVLQCCTDLFLSNPFCSVLHNVYLEIVSNVLTANMRLTFYLIQTINLPSIIVKFGNSPKIQSKNCMLRVGFMGHLTIISNLLINFEEKYQEFEGTLGRIEGWNAYVKKILNFQNNIERKELGASKEEDLEKSEELSDEDIRVFEVEIVQADEIDAENDPFEILDEGNQVKLKDFDHNFERKVSETAINTERILCDPLQNTSNLEKIKIHEPSFVTDGQRDPTEEKENNHSKSLSNPYPNTQDSSVHSHPFLNFTHKSTSKVLDFSSETTQFSSLFNDHSYWSIPVSTCILSEVL